MRKFRFLIATTLTVCCCWGGTQLDTQAQSLAMTRHLPDTPKNVQNEVEETVTGRVIDSSTGEGLPGVNVVEKGTSNGTITDVSGLYNLVVGDGATLVFSSVGYLTQEVAVSNRAVVDLTLTEDVKALEEVVVVGYGTKTKRELTGAISSIGSEAISEQTVTGIDQAMAGRLAGVQIVQNSATPGGGTSVRIRGVGTPGVNEPLYVIDGVPVFPDNSRKVNGGGAGNVLNTINPGDVASIEVLKDAASAAIYGARAANGVVLITTKKGEEGRPQLGLDYYYGIQSFEKRFDVLDANEYQAFLTTRGEPFNPSSANTDWLDEITQTASIQNASLSLSGGGPSTNYYTSVGYFKQDGIVKGTDYERFTGRFNIRSQINEKLKIGTNLSVTRSMQSRRGGSQAFESPLQVALYFPPTVPAKENAETYSDVLEYVPSFFGDRPNPLANVEVGYDRVANFKMLGNIYGEYELLKGLVYRLNLGIDYDNSINDQYFPGWVFGTQQRQSNQPNVSKYLANELIWLVENTLNYKASFNDVHHVGVLVGATQQESRFETLLGARRNAVSKNPMLTSLTSSPSALQSSSGAFDEWSLASFLGRFDYNYKGKYLFSASIRRDGSSRFAAGNQWGTFPSLSAGWIVSDESFFNINFISSLKIRGSWGQLGNQEIAPFQYLSTLENTTYVLNNQAVTGVVANSVPNPGITWETSEQRNIGLDAALLENKLTFSIDYFDKLTEGILLQNQISSVYGYTQSGSVITPTINAGVVANRGLEFVVGYQNSDHKFRWSIDANASTLKNEVVSLGSNAPILTTNFNGQFVTITDVGTQVGAFQGKVVEGVDEDGHFIFEKEENGEDLQTIIGNPIPNLTYGLNVAANYKGFDFSMSFQGVSGNDIYSAFLFYAGNFSYSTYNPIRSIYYQAGVTAPAVDVATGGDYASSDWYVYSGSYLRLRSLQIGYTLPTLLLERLKLKKVRVYLSGQNLITFDSYDVGLNPEVGAFNQNNSGAGVDYGTYPVARVIATGLNISF
ncbi:MAG: TonB-dependent receptor [Tunicatimonas sp.]